MKRKEFKPHYAGPQSNAFWRVVRELDGDEDRLLYLMGCALQDIEIRMLQALDFAVHERKRQPVGHPRSPR